MIRQSKEQCSSPQTSCGTPLYDPVVKTSKKWLVPYTTPKSALLYFATVRSNQKWSITAIFHLELPQFFSPPPLDS